MPCASKPYAMCESLRTRARARWVSLLAPPPPPDRGHTVTDPDAHPHAPPTTRGAPRPASPSAPSRARGRSGRARPASGAVFLRIVKDPKDVGDQRSHTTWHQTDKQRQSFTVTLIGLARVSRLDPTRALASLRSGCGSERARSAVDELTSRPDAPRRRTGLRMRITRATASSTASSDRRRW